MGIQFVCGKVRREARNCFAKKDPTIYNPVDTCSLLYSIIISCLDIYTWNYETKLNRKLDDKGPINYVPLYFMYIVIIMMEVQYAVVVYNVSQRFCRLNKNLENIFNSGRITDQFKKDFGLGAPYSLFYYIL